MKHIFPIIGMHCASCKILIEKMVSRLEGVNAVSVNYATEKMTIEYDEKVTSLHEIKQAVEKAGNYRLVENEEHKMILAAPSKATHKSTAMHLDQGENLHHDHAALLKQEELKKLKRILWAVGIGTLLDLVFNSIHNKHTDSLYRRETIFYFSICCTKGASSKYGYTYCSRNIYCMGFIDSSYIFPKYF